MDRLLQRWWPGDRRRGQILPLFAAVAIILVVFCALTIDVGRIATANAQLQNAVDAAALAGASQLVGFVDEDAKTSAETQARALAEANVVLGEPLTLGETDIKFGRYVPGPPPDFTPEEELDPGDRLDSVRVMGRRTTDSPDGDIPLLFAGIFGIRASAQEVRAVATQPRRYVMFVMDRSGSMCFDTTGIDHRYSPNSDGSMDSSPTNWYWFPSHIYKDGWRTAWMYAVNNDTGEIVTSFLPDHIKARLHSDTYFRYCSRDRPHNVQSGWLRVPDNITVYSAYGDDYDNWYAQGYGPISQCDYALAGQPVEPMASSQNAAAAFVDLLNPEQEQAGLVTYAWDGTLDQQLTNDLASLQERILIYDPRGATATPDGMDAANDEFINSGRAETYGQRTMILLTDGLANVAGGNSYGNPSSDISVEFCGQTVQCRIYQEVVDAIEVQTLRAKNNGIRIYTVSFGNGADQDLMPLIAQETGGAYYYAANHDSLTDIFVDIFYNLPAILTH
ncbi:MAG: VWA domain-containing protein [Candidatus Brocadiia bacterium]